MADSNLTPPQTRAQDLAFVRQCSVEGLRSALPLLWPTPPGTPPSPKRDYRSHYVYLGWHDLTDPQAWTTLSDFDLVLRLVDFSGLRPVLAQRLGWTSACGKCPFDPLSMFLLTSWQIVNGWSRAEALRNIQHPRYADYAQRFGFENGLFPSEGGMRYFLTTLGRLSEVDGDTVTVELDYGDGVEIAVQYLNQLIAASVMLILDAHLVTPEAWQKAWVCPDGMIHDAASRMRCTSVQDSCYRPTSSANPRPCPAKEKDDPRRGCDCDTVACAAICQYAPARDAQARCVWYEGCNQPSAHNPNASTDPSTQHKGKGELRYGYRSLPFQFAEPARRFSFVLLDDLLSANAREENPAAALLLQLNTFYPDLGLDVVAGDAAFGYYSFLHAIYHCGAKRVVDLRAHSTDTDKAQWTTRGYDDKGRPICAYGYRFSSNGFDAERQCHKWLCAQACLHRATPAVQLEDVSYPPHDCPYQDETYQHGKSLSIQETFDDYSIRLVRDIPVGTPTWKRFYHRARNASEDRNSDLQGWGLKRLHVYGKLRARATIALADVWLNLTTLAHLVREATAATLTSLN
jgi:hypothetical protein